MKAVVLAGGQGQRLRPFTSVLPKPLMPIGDRPILDIILRQLHQHGVTDVTIALNYLGSLIQAYVDQSEIGKMLNVHYHWEDKPLGTAGAIGTIANLDEPFIVTNGDILTSLNFGDMFAQHEATGAELTVGTITTEVQIELGVLSIDEQNHIYGYDEKPKKSYSASMGIYVYSPSVLAEIEAGKYLDAPTLVQMLMDQNRNVVAYRPDCVWIDIGNRGEHERATGVFLDDPSVFLPGATH